MSVACMYVCWRLQIEVGHGIDEMNMINTHELLFHLSPYLFVFVG